MSIVLILSACGPKLTGLAENISVSELNTLYRKAQRYKDNFHTHFYSETHIGNKYTNKPAVFCFGRKGTFAILHHLHFLSCDNSLLEVENIDAHLSSNETSYLLNVHKCQQLNSLVKLYHVTALDDFVNVLYSNSTEDNNQFKKITRIAIECDKLKNVDHVIQTMKKLRDEAVKHEADGIIDISVYRKDYNVLSSKFAGSTKLITYTQGYFVTATLIKFKGGFYPEEEFLICGQ